MVISIARSISTGGGGSVPGGVRSLITHHRLIRHQQRQPYAFLNFNNVVRKPTNSKCVQFTNAKFSSSSSSSSSSSASSCGFLKWYLRMLETRPFVTKSISSSLIFSASDVTSQMLTSKPSETYDKARTLRIAGYGLLIMGPSQHLWFNFVSRIFPERDVLSIAKKIGMGQTVYGPIMNSIFFSYNAAFRGESKEDIVGRLKRDLYPTLRNGLMYWPLCDFLTFRYTPVHLQPLVNSSFAYLWTIYLTYMASLEKIGDD